MLYSNVYIDTFGYELAPNVVTSEDLETRLSPLYADLRVKKGQLEAFTGIHERRYWNTGFKMWEGAAMAGRKAIEASVVDPSDIGMLIYGGVCRDNLEPATACAVANDLGISGNAQVYDVSNACLGVLNGMIQVANGIEMGQINAGLVVSCESAREIVDSTIEELLNHRGMEMFKPRLATLTGGSGAVAVLLTHAIVSTRGHRLEGAVIRSAPEHHKLCRWGPDIDNPNGGNLVMETDAVGVLRYGVVLGKETFVQFMEELGWGTDKPDKVICHQVGSAHQRSILKEIDIAPEKDFTTFRYLGNIGTVSLPITAAIAGERQFLTHGDRVGFLGIGSGLNCLMLGIRW